MERFTHSLPKTEDTIDVLVNCIFNKEQYIDRFDDCNTLNQFTMSLLSKGYSIVLRKISNIKDVDFELILDHKDAYSDEE